jgi:hypothetical protein
VKLVVILCMNEGMMVMAGMGTYFIVDCSNRQMTQQTGDDLRMGPE